MPASWPRCRRPFRRQRHRYQRLCAPPLCREPAAFFLLFSHWRTSRLHSAAFRAFAPTMPACWILGAPGTGATNGTEEEPEEWGKRA